MKFNSKIGWWFHIICVSMLIAMGWMGISAIIKNSLMLGICSIILLIANAALIVPIWVNTNYTITEKCLLIKCGLSKPLEIPYKDIISVKKSRNPLASSALSLDRIEITFKGGIVLISPKNKDEFIKQLGQLSKF